MEEKTLTLSQAREREIAGLSNTGYIIKKDESSEIQPSRIPERMGAGEKLFERLAAGLPIDLTHVEKEDPKPSKNASALMELEVRHAAGLVSSEKLFEAQSALRDDSCSCSGSCTCMPTFNDADRLQVAALCHPSFKGTQSSDLTTLQICESSGWLIDHSTDEYFEVQFKKDQDNRLHLTTVKKVPAAEMVKTQRGLLRECIRANVNEVFKDNRNGRTLRQITEHLIENEEPKSLLLG